VVSGRYLFIDFDGVVNALNPRIAREEWDEIKATKMRGFSIHYAPAVVEAVEKLSADGVNVVWLTTWCEHTVEFGPLGFSEHPYIGSQERIECMGWWKWEALQNYVKGVPDDALIAWCDDDLSYSARMDPTITEFLAADRVLGISPHDWPGLTRDQIAALFEHFEVSP
jgi:hypothetical protein